MHYFSSNKARFGRLKAVLCLGGGVTAWVCNLAGEAFITAAFPAAAQAGAIPGYPNPPGTFGVTVRRSF
ncbi:MAG: hypothetical protein WEA77_07010 [Hyphomonas sp.]|uniref:hypothetical protein n=1 Tax=Hyphomonas sp. TaxID=87 RepID=UPI0034A07266